MSRPRCLLAAGALVLSLTACGSAGGGQSTGGDVKNTGKPIPTANPVPTGKPKKQTMNLARGTTGYVGGLHLGVMGASNDVGKVAVLTGPDVPKSADWVVKGKAGHTEKLKNGFTVRIDEVVNAKKLQPGVAGSGGGSVTVTVMPPVE